ncbi:MAG: antibiotic biosynthesis monooxygenase [Dehalococcoidales bacterium]|nr:antibiotic biosynthesis monooxygenase [Dehalococcoidales bacterium]
MKHPVLLIVANEPEPGRDDEYNEWYSGRHIPMMFGFPGLKRASRYRRTGDDRECSQYLAVYEFASRDDLEAFFHSPEFKAAVADFEEKWGGGGFVRKWGAAYELIGCWEK